MAGNTKICVTARVPGCGCLAHWRTLPTHSRLQSSIITFLDWAIVENLAIAIEEMDITNQSIACKDQKICPKATFFLDRVFDLKSQSTIQALRVMAALEKADA